MPSSAPLWGAMQTPPSNTSLTFTRPKGRRLCLLARPAWEASRTLCSCAPCSTWRARQTPSRPCEQALMPCWPCTSRTWCSWPWTSGGSRLPGRRTPLHKTQGNPRPSATPWIPCAFPGACSCKGTFPFPSSCSCPSRKQGSGYAPSLTTQATARTAPSTRPQSLLQSARLTQALPEHWTGKGAT